LFNFFAAAVRTSDLAFIVLMQREGLFEVLAAIVAVIIVHGHKTPPDGVHKIVAPSRTHRSCDFRLAGRISITQKAKAFNREARGGCAKVAKKT